MGQQTDQLFTPIESSDAVRGDLDRAVEYAARKGQHEVVLMGEESLKPQGHAKMAGKQLRRRTTEIWSDASGTWKLLLRQATIYVAE